MRHADTARRPNPSPSPSSPTPTSPSAPAPQPQKQPAQANQVQQGKPSSSPPKQPQQPQQQGGSQQPPKRAKGFTLIEILIVVIILGILAAIVVPQFTNASTQARVNSVHSMGQSIQSQVELYRMDHSGDLPTDGGAYDDEWEWNRLTTKIEGKGPYLQSTPINTLRGTNASGVVQVDDTVNGFNYDTAVTATDTDGWVICASGKFYALDKEEKMMIKTN